MVYYLNAGFFPKGVTTSTEFYFLMFISFKIFEENVVKWFLTMHEICLNKWYSMVGDTQTLVVNCTCTTLELLNYMSTKFL